jgi:hypothetical protein
MLIWYWERFAKKRICFWLQIDKIPYIRPETLDAIVLMGLIRLPPENHSLVIMVSIEMWHLNAIYLVVGACLQFDVDAFFFT